MANHATIINPHTTPNLEIISNVIFKVISDYGWESMLTVHYNSNSWRIKIEADKHESVIIWINDEGQIETRHHHRNPIYWYLENVFMKTIAVELDGMIDDDGIGIVNDLTVKPCISYFSKNRFLRCMEKLEARKFYKKYLKILKI